MDPIQIPESLNPGLIYRLNGGFGFRIAGDNAHNDGILGTLEIGYQTRRIGKYFSFESGSSLDLFGETEHLAAYFQINYHPDARWVLSLRSLWGGVSDEKEKAAVGEDKQDFGLIANGCLQGSYRLDQNFYIGLRSGLEWQVFGKSGGDQGTQVGLVSYLNLAYHH